MNTTDSITTRIRRTANTGLYGSMGIVILTVIFYYASPYKFAAQSEQVMRWMLGAGCLLGVLAIMMVLMMIRKRTPTLRQMEGSLEQKLQAYASQVSNIFCGALAIVAIECVLILLMSDNSLLMVTILLVLLLFLAYPNMYKMKNDLGLNDEEMRSLFGEAYIADPTPEDVEAEVVEDNDEQRED